MFRTILGAFEERGYAVTWNVCNSWHFVAQQRERVFIVGVRNDLVVGKDCNYNWDWYNQLLQRASEANTNDDITMLSMVVRMHEKNGWVY